MRTKGGLTPRTKEQLELRCFFYEKGWPAILWGLSRPAFGGGEATRFEHIWFRFAVVSSQTWR